MGTLILVAAVVAVLAFAAAKATAKHNLGLAELEQLSGRVELDGATVKAVVAAVDVMGGTVTVAQEVAKEQTRNERQKHKNDSEIAEARLKAMVLSEYNQQLRERNQKLEQLVDLLPPAPAKG